MPEEQKINIVHFKYSKVLFPEIKLFPKHGENDENYYTEGRSFEKTLNFMNRLIWNLTKKVWEQDDQSGLTGKLFLTISERTSYCEKVIPENLITTIEKIGLPDKHETYVKIIIHLKTGGKITVKGKPYLIKNNSW